LRLPLVHLDLRLPLLCAFRLLTAQLLLALDREALLLLFSAVQFLLTLYCAPCRFCSSCRCCRSARSAALGSTLTALVGDTFLFVSLVAI